MATSMTNRGSVFQDFFLHAHRGDRKILIKSLRDTRNYIRSKHYCERIVQFRDSGGLEILVKLLRETVSGSRKGPKHDNKVNISNISTNISTSSTSSSRINVTVKVSHSKSHQNKVKTVPNISPEVEQTDESCNLRKSDSEETIRLEILNLCVSILATCCTEVDSKQKVKDAGCITILAKILKNESDEGVINRTARTIANLSKQAEVSACFHKQEFIPCLVQHLCESGDSNTKYSLVRALKILADTSEHRLSIIHHGGIKAILNSLTVTDENLIGLSIETVAEITHPYNFNNLKKPSWRNLWDAVGNQAEGSIHLILTLKETTKPSIAGQAFALLNNLMNSKAVRLAVGKCNKIVEFVELCRSLVVETSLPYLQCLAMCCKESVNRAKVKQSNGLDVLLSILKSSKVVHEKHIAIAGLVHFYHDDLALKYLCVNGLIEFLINYLKGYVDRELKVPLNHFVKPNYSFEETESVLISGAHTTVASQDSSQADIAHLEEIPIHTVIAGDAALQTHKADTSEVSLSSTSLQTHKADTSEVSLSSSALQTHKVDTSEVSLSSTSLQTHKADTSEVSLSSTSLQTHKADTSEVSLSSTSLQTHKADTCEVSLSSTSLQTHKADTSEVSLSSTSLQTHKADTSEVSLSSTCWSSEETKSLSELSPTMKKYSKVKVTSNHLDETVGKTKSLDVITMISKEDSTSGKLSITASSPPIVVIGDVALEQSRLLTPTTTPQKEYRGGTAQFESCSVEGDQNTSFSATSPVGEIDANIYDEYSCFLDQSPTPYSPPSVDWSSVFTLREQQGYRGLSPQSNLSSRSSSVERDIPKYQYLSERSMSPYSDVSWTDQTVEEEVQYSPIVSDDEEEEECSQYLDESSGCTTEEKITLKDETTSVDSVKCISNLAAPSSILTPSTLSPSSSLQSPLKRSRSPSVDSNYESEVIEDLPLDNLASKPEEYALHLLYKCSFIVDTLEKLANFNVIDTLLKLAVYSTQFKHKSTSILNSVLSSRLVFEHLMMDGIPHYVNTSWNNCLLGNELIGECSKESTRTTSVVGTSIEADKQKPKKTKTCPSEGALTYSCSFVQKLADVAESRFGLGVLNHLFNSPEMSRKLAAFDALSILCRSASSLVFLLIECKALQQLIALLQSPYISAEKATILVNCLQSLSRTSKVHLREDHYSNLKKFEAEQVASNQVSNINCNKDCSNDPLDVRLLLDDGSFVQANRRILGQRSQYFNRMLEGSYKESKQNLIKIPHISRVAMEIILHDLYGCQWQLCDIFNSVSLNTGMEILAIAGRFLLSDLQENVTKYCLQRQIAPENVSKICLLSVSHGCRSLWRYCLKFMLLNESVQASSFLDLSASASFHEELFQEIKSIVKDAIGKLSST